MSFAILHFAISNLWVRPDLLGTQHQMTWRNRSFRLRFPSSEGDFQASYDNRGFAYFRWGPVGDELVQVVIVELVVDVEHDIPSEPSDRHLTPDDPRFQIGMRLLGEARNIGRDFMTAYLDRVRSGYGQRWLGLVGHPPAFTSTNEIYDQLGIRVRVGIQETQLVGKDPDAALTLESHSRLVEEISADTPLPLAETLISDASYLLAYAEEPHLRQAVLLTAIACEVQIKHTLVASASGSQRPIVDVLLGNPRDFSLAAAALFDKAAKAVLGRSLREEDPVLYKGVCSLYEVRNRIAHRGDPGLDERALRAVVIAGTRGFSWARSLLDG